LSEGPIFEINPYWGIDPTRINLVEKLKLIAKAKLHLSADSGTAHLASMTDTPTVVICPIPYFNRYDTQTNVICCSNAKEGETAIASILDSLWPR